MNRFRKTILSLITLSLIIGLLTPVNKSYALDDSYDESIYEESESYIIDEDESLRDESSRSFLSSDGSIVKAIYSIPIHYQDEEGKWNEINNTLVDDEESSSGYKNRDGKHRIKFSKKVHENNMASITDGDHRISWGLEGFINKSDGITYSRPSSDDIIEKAYDNITSRITYSDVFDDIDLSYDISSLSIKENIIIKEKTDMNEFTFNYSTHDLSLSLNDEGDIEAYDEDEIIFTLPSPFMYDAEGARSEDASYELINNGNNKYIIRIIANSEWMNDESRAYPIIIDPIITTETSRSAIDTTFVTSDKPSTNHSTKLELLVGKESSEYGNCRTLVKFALPALNRGDVIIDAALKIALYKRSFYASSTPDLQINAHMATSSWSLSNVTWNSKPSYESMILDYQHISRSDTNGHANWKSFDITNAVKRWHEGTANNGIVIKSYTESGSYADTGVKGYLWPERYNDTEGCYPYILLTYRNHKGTEDIWDFDEIGTTSSGTAYINTYNGNLVVMHDDASTAGEKLPMRIAHIYNGYMADRNMTLLKPYAGKGWMLNIYQTIRPSSAYGLTGTSAQVYPYVYMDGDGTEHYFVDTDDGYIDEDGLNLKLEVTSSGYTITDRSDTVMSFNSSGNITSIRDADDNEITYTYSGGYITKVTDGNGQ